MHKIETYLSQHNSFVKAFKFTAEVAAEEERLAAEENRPPQDVVLIINPKDPATRVTRVGGDFVDRLMTGGQYTINPTADMIGAVFTGPYPPVTYDAKYFPRELRPNERNPGAPLPSHRTLDVQMFPLLHLHAEGSWLTDARDPNKVPSIGGYYRYRLGLRDEAFSIVLEAKKLFALWLLNGESKITYDALKWREKKSKAAQGGRVQDPPGIC